MSTNGYTVKEKIKTMEKRDENLEKFLLYLWYCFYHKSQINTAEHQREVAALMKKVNKFSIYNVYKQSTQLDYSEFYVFFEQFKRETLHKFWSYNLVIGKAYTSYLLGYISSQTWEDMVTAYFNQIYKEEKIGTMLMKNEMLELAKVHNFNLSRSD